LLNYATALAALKTPPAYTFDFALEHHGDRPEAQTHRVYREADRERDEIVSANGQRFPRPQVRIFVRRKDRYALRNVAPTIEGYVFTYARADRDGRHLNYVFNAYPRGVQEYEVTQITIDGTTFLPRKIAFRARNGSVDGTGVISYAKAEQYWMPQSANARAEVNGKLQTERILWARYRFYQTLPPSTFAQPARIPGPAPAG
jgi:hypothetical protein